MESGESRRETHALDIENAQVKIDAFVNKWFKALMRLGKDDQKVAALYLWIRFFLGLRSLRHLAPVNDIAGCYVMARCCLEYDIGISAIINNSEMGTKYIQYDVDAKNKFLSAQRYTRTKEEITDILTYMTKKFGPDFAERKATNWYGGFPNLCKKAKRESELELYIAYCQVTHGTITGMQLLNMEGLMRPQNIVDTAYNLLQMYTLMFLSTTDKVINLVFTDLWSPSKQNCLRELEAMAKSILGV